MKFLKRWGVAIVTVAAAILSGIGIMLMGRRGGVLTDETDAIEELAERAIEDARRKAIDDFVEASERMEGERAENLDDLGDYLDKRIGYRDE